MQLGGAAVLSATACIVAATLAVIVLRTGPGRTANRRLAAVLALESAFFLTKLYLNLAYGSATDEQPRWLEATSYVAIVGVSAAYLALLAILETPLVRPFRPAIVHVFLVVFVLATGVAAFFVGTPATDDNPPSIVLTLVGSVGTFGIILVAAYALVVSISAFRRTSRGTAARARAQAFLVAFATRDALFFGGTTFAILVSDSNEPLADLWWSIGPQITTLLYVPLLAYGLLRTQLFDIDLKIKIGIRRGTVVGIILVAVFVVAKIVETYLSRTVGFVAGSAVAGALLFLAPKLNKVGEKVASTALPKVENTSAYVEFRKLEVYKAALESALETGELSDKERETLRRLRAKLGINEADAHALERDVREQLLPA